MNKFSREFLGSGQMFRRFSFWHSLRFVVRLIKRLNNRRMVSKIMKKFLLGALGLLALTLAGCSNNKVTTKKNTYRPTALTAVVKGTAGAKHVNYQIDNGKKQTVKTNGGAYFLSPRNWTKPLNYCWQRQRRRSRQEVKAWATTEARRQVQPEVIGTYLPTKVQKRSNRATRLPLKRIGSFSQDQSKAAAAARSNKPLLSSYKPKWRRPRRR